MCIVSMVLHRHAANAAATAYGQFCRVRYSTMHSTNATAFVFDSAKISVARCILHAARRASDVSADLTAMLAVGGPLADLTPLLHLQVPQAAGVCEDPLCRAFPASESLLHCAHYWHTAVCTFCKHHLVLTG